VVGEKGGKWTKKLRRKMKEGNEESRNEGGRERTKVEKLIVIRRNKTHEKGESVNAECL
jgi:hypothetical protein